MYFTHSVYFGQDPDVAVQSPSLVPEWRLGRTTEKGGAELIAANQGGQRLAGRLGQPLEPLIPFAWGACWSSVMAKIKRAAKDGTKRRERVSMETAAPARGPVPTLVQVDYGPGRATQDAVKWPVRDHRP